MFVDNIFLEETYSCTVSPFRMTICFKWQQDKRKKCCNSQVNSVRNGKFCRAAMLANHVIEESFLSMIIIPVVSKVGLAEYMAQYKG